VFFKKNNYFFSQLKFVCETKFLNWKRKIFKQYYDRLCLQTRFLYKQSELFKERCRLLGIDFAKQTFDEEIDEQIIFFNKAQQQPLIIRFHIFMDAITGKQPRVYSIRRQNGSVH